MITYLQCKWNDPSNDITSVLGLELLAPLTAGTDSSSSLSDAVTKSFSMVIGCGLLGAFNEVRWVFQYQYHLNYCKEMKAGMMFFSIFLLSIILLCRADALH